MNPDGVTVPPLYRSYLSTCRLGFTLVLLSMSLMFPVSSNAQNLLRYPQMIVIDIDRDRLLVSNYGGGGSLVQIDSDGNQTFFVENAGCIDGMEIIGDVVYGVGNNRKLYGYNLDTGEQVLDYSLPGNSRDYLSSIASDTTGGLFISCPALHTIYRFNIADETHLIFAQDNGLNRPNGICLEIENDRIVVIDDSPMGTSKIHAISLTDATVSELMSTTFHYPDGIVRDMNGTYYVGGYYLPGLYKIDRDLSQEPEMFFTGSHMVYPTYDARDHSLLVTYYGDHSWGKIMLPTGTIEGAVSLRPAGDANEEVEINIGAITISPDNTGYFSNEIPVGIYDVIASLEGYETLSFENVEFTEDQVTWLAVELYLPPASEDYRNEEWVSIGP